MNAKKELKNVMQDSDAIKKEFQEWQKTNPKGTTVDFAIWKAGQLLRKVTK